MLLKKIGLDQEIAMITKIGIAAGEIWILLEKEDKMPASAKNIAGF